MALKFVRLQRRPCSSQVPPFFRGLLDSHLREPIT